MNTSSSLGITGIRMLAILLTVSLTGHWMLSMVYAFEHPIQVRPKPIPPSSPASISSPSSSFSVKQNSHDRIIPIMSMSGIIQDNGTRQHTLRLVTTYHFDSSKASKNRTSLADATQPVKLTSTAASTIPTSASASSNQIPSPLSISGKSGHSQSTLTSGGSGGGGGGKAGSIQGVGIVSSVSDESHHLRSLESPADGGGSEESDEGDYYEDNTEDNGSLIMEQLNGSDKRIELNVSDTGKTGFPERSIRVATISPEFGSRPLVSRPDSVIIPATIPLTVPASISKQLLERRDKGIRSSSVRTRNVTIAGSRARCVCNPTGPRSRLNLESKQPPEGRIG
ncbi:uncharacterized protein LOC141856062 [Brevipalpus obovatus]|uniref:uncharacterized protein LOC141856062 n=1 Tax=Brevipalpus obovatus TaxID=246614 RepID=UPI003D9F5182